MTTIQMTRLPDAMKLSVCSRLRVDLVGAERALAVGAHDRRIDLEDVVDAELVARPRPPAPPSLLIEACARRFSIVSPRSPSSADEKRRPIRSGARFVQTSVPSGRHTLTDEEVGLAPQLRLELEREMRRDVELVAANELRPKHAVDVLRQARAGVVERLALQRCREQPSPGSSRR